MNKPKVGIVGGAGYTGGELVRLLVLHEGIELVAVQSRSQANKKISQVHRDLLGLSELVFCESIDAILPELDVLFLALPHGEARSFILGHRLQASLRVIDLSHDFRLAGASTCGELEFIYGLPETNRERIKKAKAIANPGCFATALELALLPLATQAIEMKAVVTGITGSTGAGVGLAPTSHFSFRANNIQAYKTLTHQHVSEVLETLKAASIRSAPAQVSFVPWRGDFTRGIFISALLPSDLSEKEANELFVRFYQSHPFVMVSNEAIDLKSVVNTNQAHIEVTKVGHELVVHVAIDNLLKGASGQAVQNLNLMFGFPETMGLRLKAGAF